MSAVVSAVAFALFAGCLEERGGGGCGGRGTTHALQLNFTQQPTTSAVGQ